MKKRRKIARVAVLCGEEVVRTHPSIVDACKTEGIKYRRIFDILDTGKKVNGFQFVRTDYQHTTIWCAVEGVVLHRAATLKEASRRTGVTPRKVLELLDSGGECKGWSFDEVGEEEYPETRNYKGTVYYKGPWGYKAGGTPSTYLHRDMYEDVFGPIGNGKIQIRDNNRWNFTLDNLVVREE